MWLTLSWKGSRNLKTETAASLQFSTFTLKYHFKISEEWLIVKQYFMLNTFTDGQHSQSITMIFRDWLSDTFSKTFFFRIQFHTDTLLYPSHIHAYLACLTPDKHGKSTLDSFFSIKMSRNHISAQNLVRLVLELKCPWRMGLYGPFAIWFFT